MPFVDNGIIQIYFKDSKFVPTENFEWRGFIHASQEITLSRTGYGLEYSAYSSSSVVRDAQKQAEALHANAIIDVNFSDIRIGDKDYREMHGIAVRFEKNK